MQQSLNQYGLWHMPKAFYAILLIEFWERFAFYGLQSVAVLFFIQRFNLTERTATDLFSSFSALLYALLVIGGYLGDKLLGLRRTYLLGIIFLMIGYASFGVIENARSLYWSMGMILVGNIFFKTNAGNFVSRCFPVGDSRLDSAFTYFYMVINLGSLASMISIPFLAQRTSYSFGIATCGVGMLIALISYVKLRYYFIAKDNEVGQAATSKLWIMLPIALLGVGVAYLLGFLLQDSAVSRTILFIVAGIITLIYFIVRSSLPSLAKRSMLLAFILLIQSIFFWIIYMQMATSLTLFAVHNVRNYIFGWRIPPEVTQSFNPLFIFILSPLLASLYMRAEHKAKPISIAGKFALGMLVCGLAYLLLAIGCSFYDNQATISVGWLFASYGLYSLGELLISAIGLAMVAKLLPASLGGFAQAVWFATTAIGMKLGGIVASFATVKQGTASLTILHGYQQLFAMIGISATVLALILGLFVKPLARRLHDVMQAKVNYE